MTGMHKIWSGPKLCLSGPVQSYSSQLHLVALAVALSMAAMPVVLKLIHAECSAAKAGVLQALCADMGSAAATCCAE